MVEIARSSDGRVTRERIAFPASRPARTPLWREALGRQLHRLRKERDERLIDTASRAGISVQYLSEIQRGLKDPSSEMVAAIAGALGQHRRGSRVRRCRGDAYI